MKQRRASILVVVLFVMVVLSMLAMSFAYRAALESRSCGNRAVMAQLKAQAASAAYIAMGRLAENTNDYDHLSEPWREHDRLASEGWLAEWSDGGPDREPVFVADYQVIDEEGKLNVLYASSESLEKLGLSPTQINSLFDWMDADHNARPDGAENDYYLMQPAPHQSKNAPLQVLDELSMIRGFASRDVSGEDADHDRSLDEGENDGFATAPPDNADGDLKLGCIDLLTCVGNGRLNLNTAPLQVLQTLPLSDGAARQIAAFVAFGSSSKGSVDDHVFRSAADIEQLQGLTDADREVLTGLAIFKSQHFRIFAQAVHRTTKLRCQVEVLVRMNDQGPQILQWKAGG